ncbi:MAG: cell division protein ZipA [Gammaproteobacteria bacterium]|nr:cell division protein ZipA [Gammaproteobacteria bacterium]
MTLQIALLLVGLVIVAVVVLSSFDKARVNKHFHEAQRGRAKIRRVTKDALALIDRTLRSASRLDINPGPLQQSKKRFLKSDAFIPERKPKDADDSFYETLESFERVAAQPLDVDTSSATSWDNEDSELISEVHTEPRRPKKRQSMPDPQIDFIIDLPGKKPVSRDKALGIYKQHEYLLEKPRSIYGLKYVEGVWSNLDNDPETSQYSDLFLAIQLIDGKGPISESELNTFGQLGLKLADTLNRPSKLSMTFEQAIEKAKELSDLCDKCDAIANINVTAAEGTEFSGRDIEKSAQSRGMAFGEMNIFHKKNDEAQGCRHMFSMANLYEPGYFSPDEMDTLTARGLTLFMHIPCTHNPVAVFDDMVETARALSEDLGGAMVDQDGKVLTESGIKAIRHQIEDMEDAMEEWGIIPGSETALRLFNQ